MITLETSGNFSLKCFNFPPCKIVSDGAFVLEFRMLHVLCVPQLGSYSISVMKVRDFLRADDCVILPVCRENEQKLRTVYECCRGLYCYPSLPENPREVSHN